MSTAPHAPRHAQLFELLRQQNLSNQTSLRLKNREIGARMGRPGAEDADRAMVRALAARSWAARQEHQPPGT